MSNGAKAGRGRDEWIEYWRNRLKQEWQRQIPDPPGPFGVRIEVVAEWQGDTVNRLEVETEEVACGETWPSPPCVCYLDTITRDYDLHVKFTIYAVLTAPTPGGGTQDVEELHLIDPDDGSLQGVVSGRQKVGWGTWTFGIWNEVKIEHRVDCGGVEELDIPENYASLPIDEVLVRLLDPRRAALVIPGALAEAKGSTYLPRGLEYSLYGREKKIAATMTDFRREERFEKVSDPKIQSKLVKAVEPHATKALQRHACACPKVAKRHKV